MSKFSYRLVTYSNSPYLYLVNDTEPNIVEEPVADCGKIYTYSDYKKFQFDYRTELIRGKIFKMSPAPKSEHQEISINLLGHIWSFLKGKSCKVYIAPFEVVLLVRNEKKDTATVVDWLKYFICRKASINESEISLNLIQYPHNFY